MATISCLNYDKMHQHICSLPYLLSNSNLYYNDYTNFILQITNLSFLRSKIQYSPAYGVLISQLTYHNWPTNKLITKGKRLSAFIFTNIVFPRVIFIRGHHLRKAARNSSLTKLVIIDRIAKQVRSMNWRKPSVCLSFCPSGIDCIGQQFAFSSCV